MTQSLGKVLWVAPAADDVGAPRGTGVGAQLLPEGVETAGCSGREHGSTFRMGDALSPSKWCCLRCCPHPCRCCPFLHRCCPYLVWCCPMNRCENRPCPEGRGRFTASRTRSHSSASASVGMALAARLPGNTEARHAATRQIAIRPRVHSQSIEKCTGMVSEATRNTDRMPSQAK